MINAQPAIGVSGQIADCGVPVDMPVEQSRTQLSGVTEDNLGLRPPTPKYRGGDDPIEVAVCDYPANIQRQRFALHLRTNPSHPSIVLSQTDGAYSRGIDACIQRQLRYG